MAAVALSDEAFKVLQLIPVAWSGAVTVHAAWPSCSSRLIAEQSLTIRRCISGARARAPCMHGSLTMHLTGCLRCHRGVFCAPSSC